MCTVWPDFRRGGDPRNRSSLPSTALAPTLESVDFGDPPSRVPWHVEYWLRRNLRPDPSMPSLSANVESLANILNPHEALIFCRNSILQ
jgi:hypothetical protein